jgi:hypothetical protein
MHRWPYCFLALAVAVTVAAVFAPHSPEPEQSDTACAVESVTAPVPETIALRGWAKDQIAREVAAGRRRLLDAAALYGELNRLPPVADFSLQDVDNSPKSDPVGADAERLCRQVMTWVEQRVIREAPDQASPVMDRLEAELRAALQEQGGIRLPGRSSLPPMREVLEQARSRMTAAQRPAPTRSGQKR